MDTTVFLAAEKLRAEMYSMLSQCYQRPDDRLIPAAVELISTAKTLWPDAIPDSNVAVNRAVSLEEITTDHSRLFVGPYSLLAPPYGSVYLDGERKLMGDSTLDAERRYRESGVQLAEGFRDAPDHIVAELEFMHYLVCKECAAIETSDQESVMDWLARQHGFLEVHLGVWGPEFVEEVQKAAETDFYRMLAICTRALIRQDMEDCRRILAPGRAESSACG